METKKAYGVVTALGTKLGEKAKASPGLAERIRGTPDRAAFADVLRSEAEGLVPAALLASFLDDVITDADWVQWRARLLLQLKLVRDGGKPAPGHESGRGVRRG